MASDADRSHYVHSAGDILLQERHWFRLGGGTLERQWRDLLSIVLVQERRLDREYLSTVPQGTGVSPPLERAYQAVKATG